MYNLGSGLMPYINIHIILFIYIYTHTQETANLPRQTALETFTPLSKSYRIANFDGCCGFLGNARRSNT